MTLQLFFATLLFILFCVSTGWSIEIVTPYPQLPASYTSIKVFDIKGRFVGRILPEKRYWTGIDRIPAFLQNAVVAVEDARFFEHGGIDIRGIARALVKDVVKGRLAEGGSTITQQLIKNRYLSSEKTIGRKIDEARMAIEYEQIYTKKQILEMYFNEIYYGNGAWGIGQAARLYFDKRPEELSDAECAQLAGVQKNPARYNPLGKAPHVTARRDIVLKRMVDLKMITPQRKNFLRNNPAAVVKPGQAVHYLALIRGRLIERYGAEVAEQGGLEITAAMDLDLQKRAETALQEGVKRIAPDLQGALISLDVSTGDLLAAVGGTDVTQVGYNRAFSARRQPGSAIKPLIYAEAFESGISAASVWDDSPVSYGMGNGELWKPLNYGGELHGRISLRKALAHSNNVIAVKLLDTVGVSGFVEFAARLGLPQKADSGLSLALGTSEVSLSELVQAYTAFASGGQRSEVRMIIRILHVPSRSWVEAPPVLRQAISPAAAFITTSILKDVMTYGTARGLKKFANENHSAGKTGTTDDYRDAWFIGYTPRIVTGVWVGHDKPKTGSRSFTGGGVAAPIWERFMRSAVAVFPAGDFTMPENVTAATVNPLNGEPVGIETTEKTEEYFIVPAEPALPAAEPEVLR